MRVLLDTHVFLWWADEPARLPMAIRAAIEDASNELYVSVASIWEVQIKIRVGKLRLSVPLDELVSVRVDVRWLPVLLPHVLMIGKLPMHHKDPFDQLIIAQALAEDLNIATVDETFHKYPVRLLT